MLTEKDLEYLLKHLEYKLDRDQICLLEGNEEKVLEMYEENREQADRVLTKFYQRLNKYYPYLNMPKLSQCELIELFKKNNDFIEVSKEELNPVVLKYYIESAAAREGSNHIVDLVFFKLAGQKDVLVIFDRNSDFLQVEHSNSLFFNLVYNRGLDAYDLLQMNLKGRVYLLNLEQADEQGYELKRWEK